MGPGVTWLGCTSWCWPHWDQNWQGWISARTPGHLVQRDLSAWDRLEEFVFVSKASSFTKPLCQSKHAAVLKAGGCGRDRELWTKLSEKMEKNIGRKLGRHHLAWMHILESVFRQKSFLGTVQALTRTDWAPRAIFSDVHGQEGSPAWVHKGKDGASPKYSSAQGQHHHPHQQLGLVPRAAEGRWPREAGPNSQTPSASGALRHPLPMGHGSCSRGRDVSWFKELLWPKITLPKRPMIFFQGLDQLPRVARSRQGDGNVLQKGCGSPASTAMD